MEELLNNIKFRNVTEEEYVKVRDIIKEESDDLKAQGKQNHVFFQEKYSTDLQGIFINNTLVGFFEFSELFGGIGINIYVLPPYRNHGIATLAISKIVDEYGKEFTDKQYFYADVSINNNLSQKVFQKLNRQVAADFSLDGEMDGYASVFYKKENPYYQPVPQK